MTAVGEQGLSAAGIPHLHVYACGGEALAVGGPRHAVHIAGMTVVGEQQLSAAGIQYRACGGLL